ncbi:CDP-diacylglycerol/glycerol-3-phosphate 3-phosphatidyltransferase [Thermincola ferriacetica]|uniref:CDP-diacylglycerol--glycerol-3-phosphate 3-phosphatidyltransferase n=1 Tax=Thermincola ferriacetica TaxID=281456 RepID=A0A0L6W5A1_9FIRM|nr:CDP-diacylglycerol--glycerol-3-phosphate 3-phosphatidyltransferase [Thermincola ferriacetica]KNZ70274.1 CDP-diacylglycerol/glycerol-3-phosphate 3-phosphatidyltransferase [Thermincola ferriacetica]
MNLPNLITIGRILLIPLFLLVFWSGRPYSIQWAMLVMALAGASDIIDGYLARKLNLITSIGKILDPLADKLMIAAALTSLYLVGLVPLWLFLLIILKELILVLGSGFVVYKREYDVSANAGGKIATVSIYAALFFVSFGLPAQNLFLYMAGIMALLSFINYLYRYYCFIHRKTKS